MWPTCYFPQFYSCESTDCELFKTSQFTFNRYSQLKTQPTVLWRLQKMDCQTAKLPNLIPHWIFWLHNIQYLCLVTAGQPFLGFFAERSSGLASSRGAGGFQGWTAVTDTSAIPRLPVAWAPPKSHLEAVSCSVPQVNRILVIYSTSLPWLLPVKTLFFVIKLSYNSYSNFGALMVPRMYML